MFHVITDALRNSILITGLVTVMMMMIESLNIESKGLVFKGLRHTKTGQVIIAALLGSIPGCMGGFATVSLYTHRMFSFGALVAMMIASSGDEAFMMLAMIPRQAMILFAILFVLSVIVGIIVNLLWDRKHRHTCKLHDHSECCNDSKADCQEGFIIHPEENSAEHGHGMTRHFSWRRTAMFIGLAIFIAALGTGRLGHDHETHAHDNECHSHTHGHIHESEDITSEKETHLHEHECIHPHDESSERFHIDLLSEDWMNVMFAGLSVIMLLVLIFGSDHFVEGHLWEHIIRKHLPTIFAWTFGVLLILGIVLEHVDISHWISDNTVLMILLATLIGIIPESGPHMIFVTLYAAGVVPFPVLLASCISQDGHASIPLLAESRRSFLWAKAINCIVAMLAGLIAMLL